MKTFDQVLEIIQAEYEIQKELCVEFEIKDLKEARIRTIHAIRVLKRIMKRCINEKE